MEFVVVGFLVLVGLILVCSGMFTVQQQTMAIIERFGKYHAIAAPGLNFKIPIADNIAGLINLRVQQLDVRVDTKTEDNVFVHIVVCVQYYVVREKVYDAFYQLDNTEKQITSYVFDNVRATVPKLKLDDVFERKDDIANQVKSELAHQLSAFGYAIVTALVTDIDPDPKVKIAMNEINAAQRERVAASERGEADRILQVKRAQAEAEAKALQGKGIADQRRAIIEGLRESVEQFQQSVDGATAADVMRLVLMTQFFDTLKEIGANGKSNTLFLPSTPGAMGDIYQQLLTVMATGQTDSPGHGGSHASSSGHDGSRTIRTNTWQAGQTLPVANPQKDPQA